MRAGHEGVALFFRPHLNNRSSPAAAFRKSAAQ
jgi:hypothetical protein